MSSDSRTAPESICVLRLSAIGDTCHCLPVVRTLQRSFPRARVTWIIGALEETLMRGVDGVEFITCDKRGGWRELAMLRRRLAPRRYDVLLHMNASMRANLVSLAVRADQRIGFDRRRARDYQWLFTNRRIAPGGQEHVMDGLFGFAAALGVRERVLRWDIPVDPADRALAESLPGDRPVLLISPCSSQRLRNFRNWRADRYAAVADHAATRYGARVVLSGGPTALEREYGQRIEATTRCSPLNLIGRTSLKQLLALLERADAVVCPDSGPAHMANAVGTPVIGLYAGSNPQRTGPYDRRWVVDKYPEALRLEFGRAVSEVRWGRRVRDPHVMDLIEVADVTERIDRLLG